MKQDRDQQQQHQNTQRENQGFSYQTAKTTRCFVQYTQQGEPYQKCETVYKTLKRSLGNDAIESHESRQIQEIPYKQQQSGTQRQLHSNHIQEFGSRQLIDQDTLSNPLAGILQNFEPIFNEVDQFQRNFQEIDRSSFGHLSENNSEYQRQQNTEGSSNSLFKYMTDGFSGFFNTSQQESERKLQDYYTKAAQQQPQIPGAFLDFHNSRRGEA